MLTPCHFRQDFVVVYAREKGLPKIRVYDHNLTEPMDFSHFHDIELPELICAVDPGVNLVSLCRLAHSNGD